MAHDESMRPVAERQSAAELPSAGQEPVRAWYTQQDLFLDARPWFRK
jgi:hypothetical protein